MTPQSDSNKILVMKKKVKGSSLKYFALYILCSAIITILIFTFLFSPYKISGNSMYPGLKNGERVIISKVFSLTKLKRFDIVIFRSPELKRRIVKRIIGLPGELFGIINGGVYINRKKMELSFIKKRGDVIFSSVNFDQIKIPFNSYFILGDNLSNSIDSRNFGSVTPDMILGKVIFKYWPFSNIGRIK